MSGGADAAVLLEHGDGVSTVTLNRPERLNAIDAAMAYALIDRMVEADREPSTNVVVLTGAGRGFCAGGDTGNMGGGNTAPGKTGSGSGWDDVHHRDWRLAQTFLSMEKPSIAVVNGAAVGLGATIALLCDLVYIADHAKFGDTHVTLGLVAGDGAAITMPLLVGPQRTKQFLLTGELVTGAEVAALGLANRAVRAEDLKTVALEVATAIARQPPYACRATKAVLNRQVRWMWHEIMDYSLAVEQISLGLPDHGQAIERLRKPNR